MQTGETGVNKHNARLIGIAEQTKDLGDDSQSWNMAIIKARITVNL